MKLSAADANDIRNSTIESAKSHETVIREIKIIEEKILTACKQGKNSIDFCKPSFISDFHFQVFKEIILENGYRINEYEISW